MPEFVLQPKKRSTIFPPEAETVKTTTTTLPHLVPGSAKASLQSPHPISVAAMSATVLARAYSHNHHHDDHGSPHHPHPHPHFLVAPGGMGEGVPSALNAPATAIGGPRSSSLRRDRPRFSGSGMRISFASDTRFIERSLRSRSSSRSAATSYNLRPVQTTGDRPAKVKVRLPKATPATGVKYSTVSEEEYLNPRKAVDIAKSYGIPKYFLRGNTQVMTDGRMRLFGDNVWKKERTSLDSDRGAADSSDVINRLMDSVDKAIATSKKAPPSSADDEGTLKLEIISLKSGAEDKASLRGSVRSLQGGATEMSTASTDGGKDGHHRQGAGSAVLSEAEGANEKPVNVNSSAWDGHEETFGKIPQDYRPHTVDATPGALVRYLPKMVHNARMDDGFKEAGKFESARGYFIGVPQTAVSKSRQLASPFYGISGSVTSLHRLSSQEDKYQNVLPRFYPAVSAHRHRQAEAEKAARAKKKSGQQRLVRFADTHTVRFSNDSPLQEPIAGLVAQRAPVQSLQRSLDSHSGLSQAERFRRQKGILEMSEQNE